jgi:hypothetical protein
MASGAKKWLIGAILALAGVFIVVATVANSKPREKQAILGTPAAGESSVDAGQGTLIVWVPAGFTGDDFWVYLDGHLVSAPPHGTRKHISMHFHGKDGAWLILNPNGIGGLLTENGYFVDNDNYRSYLHANLNAESGDSKGLFYPLHFPIQHGTYTVEVAYLKNGTDQSSFPFAISPKYQANVYPYPSSVTELHIGVPDDWVFSEHGIPVMAPEGCVDKPNASYIMQQMKTYFDDPVVQALTVPQGYSNSDGIVTLDLPLAQAGSRGYDSAQIKYIASAILDRYYNIDHGPSQSYIDDCKNSHPEWSLSFDEYGRIISDAKGALQSVHRLAGK